MSEVLDKRELRRIARAARIEFVSGLSRGQRAELEACLADRVKPHLPKSGAVASYHALGPEIHPALIAAEAERCGLCVALPWFAQRDENMQFRAIGRNEVGPWGIPQPCPDRPLVEPDMVLVPLVAIDLQGNRIGQGAGHYDRAIAKLRARRPVTVVGLAWDVQILPACPPDPWDEPLDALATPTRWIALR